MCSKIHFIVILQVVLTLLLCASGLTQQNNPVDWMNDLGGLGHYREVNASLKSPTASENRVVFMGDSITKYWSLAGYFPGKPYLNRGIAGQTTPQMLIRFRQDVIELQPKVVVILAGTNDIGSNTGTMHLEDIENNYASMAELAGVHGIRVVLSSVLPIHNYTSAAESRVVVGPSEEILDLNRWLRGYCAKNGYIYLDYFRAMVDEKGLLKRDLSEDGIHPNPMGYKIMTPLAETAIDNALAQD